MIILRVEFVFIGEPTRFIIVWVKVFELIHDIKYQRLTPCIHKSVLSVKEVVQVADTQRCTHTATVVKPVERLRNGPKQCGLLTWVNCIEKHTFESVQVQSLFNKCRKFKFFTTAC